MIQGFAREKVAQCVKQLHESNICKQVEVEENISRIIIIGFEADDYEVNETELKVDAF